MRGLLPVTIVKEARRGFVPVFAFMTALGFALPDRALAAGGPQAGCGSVSSAAITSGGQAQIDNKGNQCVAGPTVTVSGSASSAGTITLTPASGEFVHIVGITVDNCAGATSVTAAAPTSITSSAGLGLTMLVGSGATAGTCQEASDPILGNNPLRASASGAQSVTMPTFATNQTVRVNVFWYSAP